MNTFYYLSGATGLLMVGYACKLMLSNTAKMPDLTLTFDSEEAAELRIQQTFENLELKNLKEIRELWTDTVIPLALIAKIWREPEPEPAKIKRPRPVFRHPEINAFYSTYVAKPSVRGNRRLVIEKLLQMLDVDGDCPSVVGRGVYANKNEQESKYGEQSYEYLAKIPLWKHSLAVTERYISKFQLDAMHPDAMIIALAHDIGKIPAQYSKFYRQSDHTVTSGLLLMGIPEFLQMGNCSELERAVQSHHDIATNHLLPTALKEADQEVRKFELAGMLAAESLKGADSEEALLPTPPMVESTGTEIETGPLPDETDDPGVGRNPAPGGMYVPHLRSLPDWIHLDAVLTYIGERINVIIKDPEMKGLWHAYSVVDGYVWVSEKLIWKAVKEISGNQVDLISADGNEAERRDWLYSIVRKLGDRGNVCSAMMKDGYYQAPVTIITGTGKTIPGFYVPFLSRAFGVDAATLERLKGSQIRGLVKNIVPKIQVGNQ